MQNQLIRQYIKQNMEESETVFARHFREMIVWELHQEGKPPKEIAKVVGMSPSTVIRDIKGVKP